MSSGPALPHSQVIREEEEHEGEEENWAAKEQRRILKGKGRARTEENVEDEEDDPRSPAVLLSPSSESEGHASEPPKQESEAYPPMTEAEKESRAVEEHLASMYKAEKARRASVRRSASVRTSSTSSLSSDKKRGTNTNTGSSSGNPSSSSSASSLLRRLSGFRPASPVQSLSSTVASDGGPRSSTSSTIGLASGQQQQQQQHAAGVYPMQALAENEDESADSTPKASRRASKSASLSINTTLDSPSHSSLIASPLDMESRADRIEESGGGGEEGRMTPVERAVKTGSRFAEDLEWNPAVVGGPDLKRHSAPVAHPLPSPTKSFKSAASPTKSNSGSRFRFSLPNGSNHSVSNIFQHIAPSRTSLHMVTHAPPDGGDLGEGPRPLPTPNSFDTRRSSYFAGAGASADEDDDSGRSIVPDAGGPQAAGAATAPPEASHVLSPPSSSTAASANATLSPTTKYRQRRTSNMTEEQGLMAEPPMSSDSHVGGRGSIHAEADALEAERRARGRGARWKARQEMGWCQWFFCLGCVIEVEDDDEEAQTGRTGPDLF